MSTTTIIPGNIKQQYLPFVLSPSNKLNISDINNTDQQKQMSPQLFSFRDVNKNDFKGGVGRLQICPSSMTNLNFGNYFEDDISYKLLFGNNNGVTTGKSISLNDILNTLPGVEIREFLPDTNLDQSLNFFSNLMKTIKEMFTENEDETDDAISALRKKHKDENKTQLASKAEIRKLKNSRFKGFFSNMKEILEFAFNYITSGNTKSKNNFLGNFFDKKNVKNIDTNLKFSLQTVSDVDKYILHFPYLLYYRLQSCTTNNLYVLPCKVSDNAMYSSDGKPGWVGGTNSIGITNTFLTKMPLFGPIIKNILGNVAINFMPWWDAGAGAQTPPPEINIKFDLYNDTEEAAMINFIFVNTIVPNNKWLQYGMFQHSPNLYDIKIEGYNRLFACAGSFSVQAEGVLRTPSKKWIYDLMRYHTNFKPKSDSDPQSWNGKINNNNVDMFFKNKLIKIPDIYRIEMTFQSLLPANFNNFLYTYANNNKITTQYGQPGNIRQESLYKKDLIDAATTDFSNAMAEKIKEILNKNQ